MNLSEFKPRTRIDHWLRLVSFLAVVMSVMAFGAVFFAHHGTHNAVNKVGRENAPSVVLAETLRYRMADLNAQAINSLLHGGLGNKASDDAFVANLDLIANNIVSSANGITVQGEKQFVIELEQCLYSYLQTDKNARVEARHGNPVAASYMTAANKQMVDVCLAKAQKITEINKAELDTTFGHIDFWDWGYIGLAALFGFGVTGFIWSQHRFMRRTFKRRRNWHMLAAIWLCFGATVFTCFSLTQANRQLHQAKVEAFESSYPILTAKAVSFIAAANESMWLLDGGRKESEDAFKQNVAQLLDPAVTDQLVAASDRAGAAREFASRAMAQKQKVNGAIGDALASVSYAGEDKAVTDMLVWYVEYMYIDGQIRALERGDKHQDALNVTLGNQPGQSKWAFRNFQNAVDAAQQINSDAFQQQIDASFSSLALVNWVAAACFLLAAFLSVFGILPRINEWR